MNDPIKKRCTRYNENSESPEKRCVPVPDEVVSQIHTHKQNNQNDAINGFDTTFTTPKKSTGK